MADPRDYKLDIKGLQPDGSPPPKPRPFLRVQFACCNVYQRIYRSLDEKSYQGPMPQMRETGEVCGGGRVERTRGISLCINVAWAIQFSTIERQSGNGHGPGGSNSGDA